MIILAFSLDVLGLSGGGGGTGPGAAHAEDDDQEEDGGGGAHQDPDHEGDPLHLLHLHPVTGAAQLPTGAAILRRERCEMSRVTGS